MLTVFIVRLANWLNTIMCSFLWVILHSFILLLGAPLKFQIFQGHDGLCPSLMIVLEWFGFFFQKINLMWVACFPFFTTWLATNLGSKLKPLDLIMGGNTSIKYYPYSFKKRHYSPVLFHRCPIANWHYWTKKNDTC